MTYKPPRIEIGTREMRNAYESGLEYYRPTLGGHRLAHPEAGVTGHSLDNLKEVVEFVGPPRKISVGVSQGIWIEFADCDTYLATGFSIGYRGEGPTGLARFAAEHGFGEFKDLIDQIAALSQDFQGVLFKK